MKGYQLIHWTDLEVECPMRGRLEEEFDLPACSQTCVEYCDGVPASIAHIWCPVKEAEG